MNASLDRLVDFFQTLTPDSVARLREFYADDAYFKDPFNEVRGRAAIERVFRHMFRQVREPRFIVNECLVGDSGTMLVWEFHYRLPFGRSAARQMRGVTHLRFDGDGRVVYHRDYWDAAEELYMKLPAIGCVMRGLRRAIAA